LGGLAPLKIRAEKLTGRKSADPSPESIARANRQRLAQEEGARAMADAGQKAIAVRKNMERLRALREAREAQQTSERAALPAIPKKRRGKLLSE
jgi:hypothetical protein